MLITYPYRNNLSTYAAGFVDTEIRESPETLAAGPAEPGRTTSRCATTHSAASAAGVEGAGGSGGPGRASRSTTPSRRLACGDLAGGRARRRPEHQRRHNQPSQRLARATGPDGARNTSGQQATRSRPAPQGLGGSRVRPLGGSQRLFQRIWVPSEPRRWQASTTRAAMPASADLPHVRGSYCFLTPTSPSILRTPS